jgi:hypothetical protein
LQIIISLKSNVVVDQDRPTMSDEPAGLDLSLEDMIKQSRITNTGHQRRRQFDAQRGPSRARGRGFGGGKNFDQPRRQQPSSAPPAPRLKYFVDETGTVVVAAGVGKQEYVRVTPAGDITVLIGSTFSKDKLNLLNQLLNPINVRLTCSAEDPSSGNWMISDGKTLRRFEDGVVLAGKGQMGRGQAVMDAVKRIIHVVDRQRATAAMGSAGSFGFGGGMQPMWPHGGNVEWQQQQHLQLGVPPPPPPPRRPGGKRDVHGMQTQAKPGTVFDRLGPSSGVGRQDRYTPY